MKYFQNYLLEAPGFLSRHFSFGDERCLHGIHELEARIHHGVPQSGSEELNEMNAQVLPSQMLL